MSLDILAALDAAPAGRTGRACKIQRWLDTLPDDAPGKEALVATMAADDSRDPHYRRLDQLDALTARLGLDTSIKTIGEHRARKCRCFR